MNNNFGTRLRFFRKNLMIAKTFSQEKLNHEPEPLAVKLSHLFHFTSLVPQNMF